MNKIYIVYYEDSDTDPSFLCCTKSKEKAIEEAEDYADRGYYINDYFVIEYDLSKECFVRYFTDGAEVFRKKGINGN
jgi:hypothetical protein